MGCGCGMTCWRRLAEWQAAGVWAELHRVMLSKLHAADRIDWSRSLLDSSHGKARHRRRKCGPSTFKHSPVDRSRCGSKHHVLTDSGGVPPAVTTTAANTADVVEALRVVVSVPPVRGKPGRPKTRPALLVADKAYDSAVLRLLL